MSQHWKQQRGASRERWSGAGTTHLGAPQRGAGKRWTGAGSTAQVPAQGPGERWSGAGTTNPGPAVGEQPWPWRSSTASRSWRSSTARRSWSRPASRSKAAAHIQDYHLSKRQQALADSVMELPFTMSRDH
eukprot:6782866-Pyramimonas_sp.AAC.1